MSRTSYSIRSILVLFLLAVMSVPATAGTPQVPGQDTVVPETTVEDAFEIHAEMYAADVGVTLEEAKRRLQLQEQAASLSEQLKARERDVVVELRLRHSPEFGLTIFVTEDGEDRVRPYLVDGPFEDLVVFEVVENSFDVLLADYMHTQEALIALSILHGGVITESEAKFFVTDAEWTYQQLREFGHVLPPTVVIVEVEYLDDEEATVIGGFKVLTPGNCTSGYEGYRVVPYARGVFTAGHCGSVNTTPTNPLTFTHIGSDEFALLNEHYGVSSDYQLHAHNTSHTLRNMINIGTTWVPITDAIGRTSMIQSMHLCVFGQATAQHRCGFIFSTSRAKGSQTHNGVTYHFTPTFIWMKNVEHWAAQNTSGPEPTGLNLSNSGDSGGPWHGAYSPINNYAFGIHSSGLGLDAIFTPSSVFNSGNYRIFVNCPTVSGLIHNCTNYTP